MKNYLYLLSLIFIFSCIGEERVIHPRISKKKTGPAITQEHSHLSVSNCDLLKNCIRDCSYNTPITTSWFRRTTLPKDTSYYYLQDCESRCKNTYFCD